MKSPLLVTHRRHTGLLLLLALCALWLVPEASAAKGAKAKMRNGDGDSAAESADAAPGKRNDKANATPAATEARQLAKLRERLEVTDDEEWTVIADRITKVEESRRNFAGGPRAAAAPGDKGKRNARGGAAVSPDIDALRSAVSDNYPDAEIKARLSRAHDAYLQREAQLVRAQGELRAVLSVRQEAVVVMAGLLPP